jgi:hypothetical protein
VVEVEDRLEPEAAETRVTGQWIVFNTARAARLVSPLTGSATDVVLAALCQRAGHSW